MNPIFGIAIGFVVVALLVIWVLFELLGRRNRNKKTERGRWVRLVVSISDVSISNEQDSRDATGKRAIQDGHDTLKG
jgi:hypothetical protein